MTTDGPRRLGDLLESRDIGRLRAEAAERRELAARVRAALGDGEAPHVVSARIDDAGRLVVGMDSPAWAARLRYSKGELLGRPIKVRVTAPGEAGNPSASPTNQSATDGTS
jgi:hypothetical protein